MTRPPLKQMFAAGDVTFGSWLTLAHPAVAEIMAKSGFDWLVIDLEHSVITIREAEELIRVVELCGVAPLVRLTSNDANQIKRVMDSGACGVVVPMVNSREEAERAVAAVQYPPRGVRGVGLARAQGWGPKFDEYRAWLARDAVVIVQIEHVKAVERLQSILTTPGVDGFIVGPYDLSGSLGVPGEFEHPLMADALREILRIAAGVGAMPGFHVVPPQPALVEERLREGYRLIGYSVDTMFLGESCRDGLHRLRGRVRPQGTAQ